MKKEFILCFMILSLGILLSTPVFAVSIAVEKMSNNEVWVSDLNKPVTVDLKITNLGGSDNFMFYNLLGFSMFPVGTVQILNGEVKDIQLQFIPLTKLPNSGYYTFPYYIRGSDGSEVKQEVTFQIVSLSDAFEVGSADVNPQSQSMEVYIKNKDNFDFGNISATFTSPFFSFQKSFTLGAYETRKFAVQLNNDDFRSLLAGFYTLKADVSVESQKTNVEGTIKFVEKDIVTTTKKEFGWFVHTNSIDKKNQGNTVETSETVLKKNIISRLFTTFSPDPDMVERKGFNVYYSWERALNPGQDFTIVVRTNWFFPFIIIVLVVAVVLMVRRSTEGNLILRKRVSFVKAKGGEFALKVSIFVRASQYVERVSIVDRLPPLVTLYGGVAGDKPTKIDYANKRLEWNFGNMSKGETRVLSYVIYSKVGVVGKFALPTATAVFERNGDVHEEESNRVFFVADQVVRRDDE